MRGVVIVLMLTLAGAAVGQVPPGFEVVQVTTAEGLKSRPDINNSSVAIWSERVTQTDADVLTFAHGIVKTIGTREMVEGNPRINDFGDYVVLASKSISGPFEVAVYNDDELVQVFAADSGGYCDINDSGQVVWLDFHARGGIELVSYNGKSIEQFTHEGFDNQMPRINAYGSIVFQSNTPKGDILIRMYDEGRLTALTSMDTVSATPDLNDIGQVVWLEIGETNRVVLYEEGRLEIKASGPGVVFPRINNNGDLVYGQWNSVLETSEIALQIVGMGTFTMPTLGLSAGASNINDHREITWHGDAEGVGDAAIVLLRRTAPDGDFDHDCHRDAYDFAIFENCWTGSDAGPEGGLLAGCNRADFDKDGDVDHDDFVAFSAIVAGPADAVEGCVP